MIRINLLPHREEKRKARRQQFYGLAGMVAILGALIVGLGYSVIAGYIGAQEGKNEFLKQEIAGLDKQIAQIKTLKDQIRLLLSRKQVIESLQRDRAESVQLLNELAKQMPDGVYVKSFKQVGQVVNLGGFSQSNARVSTLMRNLESSPIFESPTLIQTAASNAGGRRSQEFALTVRVTRAKPDEGQGGGKGGGKAGAPAPAPGK